jgi:hypothetical protein
MKRIAAVLMLLAASAVQAESKLPFGRAWAGDHDLPKPYGVGMDLFSMDQDYQIKALEFELPGASVVDPSLIRVRNSVTHVDVKGDAWLLPFLNVFGFVGKVHANTPVDLGAVSIPNVPAGLLNEVVISYSGEVYGGGLTLAYGGEHWFTAVTGTYAESSLSGDFDSEVTSHAWQPRFGFMKNDWAVWVGGMFIDVEERHAGSIALPFVGSVPFAVELENENHGSFVVGAQRTLADTVDVTFEFSNSGRRSTLLNLTWRFGE